MAASFGKLQNHTLELKEPIKLTGDNFAIVLGLESKKTDGYAFPMEIKLDGTPWKDVKLEKDKSYWSAEGFFEENTWMALSDMESLGSGFPNGDFPIKAFTISALPKGKVESIDTILGWTLKAVCHWACQKRPPRRPWAVWVLDI